MQVRVRERVPGAAEGDGDRAGQGQLPQHAGPGPLRPRGIGTVGVPVPGGHRWARAGGIDGTRHDPPGGVTGHGDRRPVRIHRAGVMVARIVGEGHVRQPGGVPPHVVGDLGGGEPIGDGVGAGDRVGHEAGGEPVGPVVAVLRARGDRAAAGGGVRVDQPGPVPRRPRRGVHPAPARRGVLVGELMAREGGRDEPPRTVIPVRGCRDGRTTTGGVLHDPARLRPDHLLGDGGGGGECPPLPGHPPCRVPGDRRELRPTQVGHRRELLQPRVRGSGDHLPAGGDLSDLPIHVIPVRGDHRRLPDHLRGAGDKPSGKRLIGVRRQSVPHVPVTGHPTQQIRVRRDRGPIRGTRVETAARSTVTPRVLARQCT